MPSTEPVSEVKEGPRPRPTIAIIGGGPAAMFFCHALEIQKKELVSNGEDVSGFPTVQCYERSPGPGGVWRCDRKHEGEDHPADSVTAIDTPVYSEEKKEEGSTEGMKTAEKTPNMYSALWTNGAKESFEFPDYTFRDHFGDVRMPTYLPRKLILDYIMGRCTRNCPNFFEKYFSFQTSVVNVKYQEGNESDANNNSTFRVQTRDETTGVEEIKFFDKCIWAGGLNGIPYIPKKLMKLFKEGGFTGPLVHSSDTTNFKKDVENKRLLIVGGGFSAEDLALMAIKEGVSHVYCTYRSENKEIDDTSRWPYDKVDTYAETTIKKVEGSTVTLGYVVADVRYGGYKDWECDEQITLKNIDTVIFCTGYRPNMNMLDQSLQDLCYPRDDWKFKVPNDWKMKKSKFLELAAGKDFGHIKPASGVWKDDYFFSYHSNLYRGCISIDNPNMVYFLVGFTDSPLMEIDVAAWMIVRYVTGQKELPSREEMRQDNYRIDIESLDNVAIRYSTDWKFNEALDEEIDWDEISSEAEEAWEDELVNKVTKMQCRLLGEIMNDHGYPISHLCEDGKTFSQYHKNYWKRYHGEDSRNTMHEIEYDNPTEGGEQEQNLLRPGWKTFRDAAKTDACISFFTGIKACPLPKPWFEIDEDDKLW